MSDRIAITRKRAQEMIRRHFRVLNKLEPHLGCVVCRGPLVGGVCERCEQERP